MESFANLTDEMLVKLYEVIIVLLTSCWRDMKRRFFLISFLLYTIKMWLMIYSRKRL